MNPRVSFILFIISAIYLTLSIAESNGRKNTAETCKNKHGWPPFKRDGMPPGPAKDINFCRGYSKKTCCDRKQTSYIREILGGAQDSINPDCLMGLVDVQCSICHRDIGTNENKKVPLCQSECQKLYDACIDDYFVIDTMTHILRPCRPHDIICSGLAETAASPSEFAEHLGFECIQKNTGVCFDDSMKPKIEDSTTNTRGGDSGRGEEKSGLDSSTLGMIVGMAMVVSGLAKFLSKQTKPRAFKTTEHQRRRKD